MVTTLNSSIAVLCSKLNSSYNSSFLSSNSSAFSLRAVDSSQFFRVLSMLKSSGYIVGFSHQSLICRVAPNLFFMEFFRRNTISFTKRFVAAPFTYSTNFISAKRFRYIYKTSQISPRTICFTPFGIFYAHQVYKYKLSVNASISISV